MAATRGPFPNGPPRRPSSDRTAHPSYFVVPPFSGRVGVAAGSSSSLVRPAHHLELFSPPAEVHPSVEFHKLGVPMTRHMIWAEEGNFTGWYCSRCPVGRDPSTPGEYRHRARLQSRDAGKALTNTPGHITPERRRRRMLVAVLALNLPGHGV